jgi:hypothetical protein
MYVAISPEQFLQICRAGTVEGKLGIKEFRLLETHIEALNDLASRMPLGNTPDGKFTIVQQARSDRRFDRRGREVLADANGWESLYSIEEWLIREQGVPPRRKPDKNRFEFSIARVPAHLQWEASKLTRKKELDFSFSPALTQFSVGEPERFQVMLTSPGDREGHPLIKKGDPKQKGTFDLTAAGDYKVSVQGNAGYWRLRVFQDP